MKILFQVPHLNTFFAGRTIYQGYKSAALDLKHDFKFLTADDDQKKVFDKYKPDIFITSINPYFLKFLDLEAVAKQKKKGMKVFVNTPFWRSPMSKMRINEAPSLSTNKEYVKLIKSGVFGDIYYNICAQGDARMDGFEKETGYKHHTILLAADKFINFPEYDEKFKADVSFVGSNLPDKRDFFRERVLPLKNKYDLKLYGQDWTAMDKYLNITNKIGQFFNIPYIKDFKKPNLAIEDERRIYSSSIVSINVHEQYQREFGGDCNERTFKIPACGGFEITDDVSCIKKYFKEGEEMVIAHDTDDWFDKINFYIKNPSKRTAIINKGRKKVLKDHTYHNRVKQIIKLYKGISNGKKS